MSKCWPTGDFNQLDLACSILICVVSVSGTCKLDQRYTGGWVIKVTAPPVYNKYWKYSCMRTTQALINANTKDFWRNIFHIAFWNFFFFPSFIWRGFQHSDTFDTSVWIFNDSKFYLFFFSHIFFLDVLWSFDPACVYVLNFTKYNNPHVCCSFWSSQVS